MELPELPAGLVPVKAEPPPQAGETLGGGRRHEGLVAIASDLLNRGVVEDDLMRGALLEANRVRCRPPKPTGEVEAIAAWAVTSRRAERVGRAAACSPS